MIIGQLALDSVASYYPNTIQILLHQLRQMDLLSMPIGRYAIPSFNADLAWIQILSYQTQDFAAFEPEKHHFHSDLQMVLQGTEKMKFGLYSETHLPSGAYDAKRDLQYYDKQIVLAHSVVAAPFVFYLFTPNILHITGIDPSLTLCQSRVKKVVVKIHNELLGMNS